MLHPPQINSFYPNSQPPNPYIFQQPEYQNMRMYQPNQGYHPFTQFPPQQNMPSQFMPQQPMKVYPNQWNQARKNQQMRMPSYLNENPQFPTYHQNPQFVQQNPQMMQV